MFGALLIELGEKGLGISITDPFDIYLFPLLASLPAIYAGIFWFKFIRSKSEASKDLAIYLAIGILLASLYDLTKETAGLSGSTLRSPADAFNVLAFSIALLGFIGIHAYTKSANNASLPLLTAYIWAILGVGLHSVGEGAIIGYDFSTGATSLSGFQIASFALHKAGEGFTIGILLMRGNFTTKHAIPTGILAGLPILVGAGMGFSGIPAVFATYFFAAAMGATIFVITKFVRLTGSLKQTTAVGVLIGFLYMYFAGVLHQFE